jgi:intergrase/recombinase
MRASSVGIDRINVCIPPLAFVSGRETAIVTFEDMWLMMNLQRLDVQLVTVFAL